MHFYKPENMFMMEMQLLYQKCNSLHGVGTFRMPCFRRKTLIFKTLRHGKTVFMPLPRR